MNKCEKLLNVISEFIENDQDELAGKNQDAQQRALGAKGVIKGSKGSVEYDKDGDPKSKARKDVKAAGKSGKLTQGS